MKRLTYCLTDDDPEIKPSTLNGDKSYEQLMEEAMEEKLGIDLNGWLNRQVDNGQEER